MSPYKSQSINSYKYKSKTAYICVWNHELHDKKAENPFIKLLCCLELILITQSLWNLLTESQSKTATRVRPKQVKHLMLQYKFRITDPAWMSQQKALNNFSWLNTDKHEQFFKLFKLIVHGWNGKPLFCKSIKTVFHIYTW
jgi:hypothetical protein